MAVVWDNATAPGLASEDENGNSLVGADLQWQYRYNKTWKDMSPMMHAGCLAHVHANTLT